MKKIDWQSFYGEPTDALRRTVADALQKEETPVKRKSFTAILITALLIVLLAATAVAVVSQMGLLDMMDHYDPDNSEEIAGMILTDIPQEGGDLEGVSFEVLEAIYDGHTVHFAILATPKEEGTHLTEFGSFWRIYDSYQEFGSYFGIKKLAGLFCEADVLSGGAVIESEYSSMSGIASGSRDLRDGRYLRVYEDTLPPGISPEELTIRMTIGYTEDLEYPELSEMTFTLPKTAEATVRSFDVDKQIGENTLHYVSITHTPLELTVRILQDELMDYMLIDEDGVSRAKLNHTYTISNEDETSYSFQGIWGTPAEMPDTLTLWIQDTNMAMVIDTQTGEITLHPAKADNDRMRFEVDLDQVIE